MLHPAFDDEFQHQGDQRQAGQQRRDGEGRGELVDSPEKADTVFGLYEGTVTAFDTDVVLSTFLA